ncbi:MAG: formimidoylglutamase [Bdellovibrio sp.]|jgi:formiminoglutamase
MRLTLADPQLFYSKNDPDDPRLGDLAGRLRTQDLSTNPQDPSVVIWGAPDDDGIKLNGGRLGAASAPTEIRRAFYKMTPPAKGSFPRTIQDLGNLPGSDQQGRDNEPNNGVTDGLNDRHALARELAKLLHSQGHFCVSLGGGHDYGFPDAAGFVEAYHGQNPLVLNFDAHLDVRPLGKGFHSGTPFRRLLQEFKGQFEFWELGLQSHCNAKAHRDWAQAQGAKLVDLADLLAATPKAFFPMAQPKRPCFISLDMDVFSNKEAPGCSASYPTGLMIESFLPWLHFLKQNFSLKGMGFYEVSPPLDLDQRTSKLAALILYQTLLDLRAPRGPT